MNKKILAISTILLMSLTQAADLQTIKDNGYVRIGVSGSKPPFGIMVEGGDSEGFEAEICRNIVEDLFGSSDNVDDRIFFEPVESVDRIPFLQQDKVDFVIANFSNTPERAKLVDFAEPYMKTQLGVVSPKGAPITDLKQLKGKVLAVVKGTTAERYFDEHMPDVKLARFAKNSDAFSQFSAGKADALAQNSTLLFPWAKKHPEFVVGVPGFGKEIFIAPAVQKGNAELLAFINGEIDKMRQDGRIDAAYSKTLQKAFGDTVPKEAVLVIPKKSK